MTHWVSNSTIEMESSKGSSGLVTVAQKCFVMDSVHKGFDSIAGSSEHKAKKATVHSLANTFGQPRNPPVPNTV